MDIVLKLGYIFIDLLLPLMLGYFFHSKHWLSEQFCNRLMMVNILVFCTALSVLSFWVLPLTFDLIWLPVFGVLLSIIPGAAAYMSSLHRYKNGLDKGAYLASAMLSNLGTLGGLCAYILFGESGFAYTQIVSMFQNLVLFLFCFPMAQYYQRRNEGLEGRLPAVTFSSLFFSKNQLPIVGLAVGMVFYLCGVPRPAFLGELFNPLIHITAWTALIPVGYSIDFSAMKKYYKIIWDLVPIKFIITPLISYLAAYQLFHDPVILYTILLLSTAPTAINAVVTARLYGLNLHIAGAAFVLTTAVFLFIVYPMLFLWLSD